MSGILDGRWRRRDFAIATAAFGVSAACLAGSSLRRSMVGAALGVAVPSAVAVAVTGRVAGPEVRAAADRPPHRRSRPADVVTFVRAGLAGCAVAAALQQGSGVERSWRVAGFAIPALALDAVDGVVARATGTSSEAGARLDMQTDSVVLLQMSMVAAGAVTPAALVIGAARYVFVAGRVVRPAWAGELPPSGRRRAIAALQGVALASALAPAVPMWWARRLVGCAAVALVGSFGRDVVLLERAAKQREASAGLRARTSRPGKVV